MRFGIFDHIEPVPGQRLDQIYRERLVQIERLDKAGFYAYHLAEHHTPAIHSLAPPFCYMRNPVTAAREGMHTIIVGSLDGLGVAVPRYRAAWEEHQGRGTKTLQGEDPMIGLVVHLVVAETDEEALEAAKPAWEKYRSDLAAP